MVEARKLSLPTLSLFSPPVTSLLYHPESLSLALMHADSTFSLFSPFSPFSLSSFPSPQTLISRPCSSACFLSLNPNPTPNCNPNLYGKGAVFIAAGPHRSSARVLLRFYVMQEGGKFVKLKVNCTQNGVNFDPKLGVIVDVKHGMKVMLAGSVNYFAIYSASAAKVLVFGLKMVGNVDYEVGLKLVKCAVIDCCCSPVFSLNISFGFLILGESNGVRVFPLHQMVKGRIGNRKKSRVLRGKMEKLEVKLEGRDSKLRNGVIRGFGENHDADKSSVNSSKFKDSFNVDNDANATRSNVSFVASLDASRDSLKLKSIKLRQDSSEWGACFMPFNSSAAGCSRSTKFHHISTKATSIQALSPNKFLIADSEGDLHILHMSKPGNMEMRKLSAPMKVQHFAVLPDTSYGTQIVCVADGLYTAHMMTVADVETCIDGNDGNASDGKLVESSVTQAIFTSESIRDLIPSAAYSVLILGQDSLFAYAIS